jgi:hypothetical protein
LEVAASGSLAGVAFFGALLSCVSRLKTVVSRAFFLLFHGSHTMYAASFHAPREQNKITHLE